MSWLDSRMLYTALVGGVAVLRLAELPVSRRNLDHLLARGGVESGRAHYPYLLALHAAWLVACPAEVWLARRPLIPPLAGAMLGLFGVGMALRLWAIRTLAERWSTRIVVVPGLPPVASGPYRYLHHPNYLGVMLEIVALPLVHSAWLTAAFFGVVNALLLRLRIRVEDEALGRGVRNGGGGGSGCPGR
jgi:methyltransferase